MSNMIPQNKQLQVGDIWTDSDGDVMQVCADGRSYCILTNAEIAKWERIIRAGLARQFGPRKRLVAVGNRNGIMRTELVQR